MAEEVVVPGTAPENADTDKPVTTPAPEATGTEPPKSDAAPAEEQVKKPDPLKAELSYLKRKLARQERDREQLLARLIENQNRPVQQDQTAPPKLSDFQSVEDFLDARDKYQEASRPKVQKDEGQERYLRAVQSARDDLMSVGSDKYEDFEEIVSDESVKITPPMRDAIFDIDEIDTQAEVTWYLAQNPKEAAKIAKLPVARQIKEIDRLEAKLKAKPVKKASAAPEPIEPIGGADTKPNKLRPDDSMEEHIKKRRQGIKFAG